MKMLSIDFSLNNILLRIDKVVIFVFLITTAYVRIINNNSLILLLCSTCLTVSGVLNFIRILKNIEMHTLIIAGGFFAFWIIELIGRSDWHYDFKYLISSISYIGIAYSFLTIKRKVKPYLILYYGIALFILLQILVFKVPYNAIMKEGSSYNYISIMLLFYLLLVDYIQIENNKELSYIPGFVFLVVAVISYGRGGIVTALIYNILLLIAKAIIHKRTVKTYLIGTLIIGIVLISGRLLIDRLLARGYLNKFLYYGMDNNGRSVIWAQFLNTCNKSLWSFLMGGNPRVLDYADNNMHNSFLQLYASFGFIWFSIILCLLIREIANMCLKRKVFMLVIAITFIARAMTDRLMFRGYYEILFYIILMNRNIRYKLYDEFELLSGL